jgi:polysaccharide biosynthesis transport protein
MDFTYLLRILNRRKWIILGAMAFAMLATYWFIGKKPERYKSSVVLSTGIVNYKGINSDNSDAFVQQYQVENAFSNLIEFAMSRSSIKLLSVEMLRHDLGKTPEGAFRQPQTNLSAFSPEEAAQLHKLLAQLPLDSLSDPAFSPEIDYALDKIGRAYGYDHDALLRSLSIKRKGATDNLLIEVITESPQLSKFMANAYATRFLTYYQNLALSEKRKTVHALLTQAEEKKIVLDSAQTQYFAYLSNRGLPALGKQSEEVVSQLSELRLSRQRAESKRRAANESVDRIQRYIDDRSSLDAGETRARIAEKSATEENLERVRTLTAKSLETGGKDPEIEGQLADAKRELDKSLRSGARSLGKPRQTDESRRTKEDLYKDKVSYDLERIDAEKSIGDIDREIGLLSGKLSTYVDNDEMATKLAAGVDLAQKELDAVNEQLIEAKLKLEKAENPRKIIENAQLPEWPESDRRVLSSLFAGIVAGAFSVIVILVLAYLDRSLRNPELFKKRFPDTLLLGAVSKIAVKDLDFQAVFEKSKPTPAETAFREGLRKIRAQLLQDESRILLFSSLKPAEGKTFCMHALAWSLAANGKKVLLVDTNFKSPLPEAYTTQASPNAARLNELLRAHALDTVFQIKREKGGGAQEQLVEVLGNTGAPASPSEQFQARDFAALLQALRQEFDYIFLESAALNQYSDAQELLPYTQGVIWVFNAANAVGDADQEGLEWLAAQSGVRTILTNV